MNKEKDYKSDKLELYEKLLLFSSFSMWENEAENLPMIDPPQSMCDSVHYLKS